MAVFCVIEILHTRRGILSGNVTIFEEKRNAMDDFRLRVFVCAARTLSFTKTAKELFISQPAVSKNIVEIERKYNVPLFLRRGSMLELTAAGAALRHHAEAILTAYDKMNLDMGMLTNNLTGELRIGASTTISQYVLPPILAQFCTLFPGVRISLQSHNSTEIEEGLIDNAIDIGLVENCSRRQALEYRHYKRDELVLVAAAHGRYADVEQMKLDEVCRQPLVLRESGSGTLEVIERQLAAHDVPMSALKVVMHLGSTEAIKSFILNSDTLALISVYAVREELAVGKLRIIDIENLEFTRNFEFTWRRSERNALCERFMDFAAKG
jgi:DNA-binding transcriptional LysR family regulator